MLPFRAVDAMLRALADGTRRRIVRLVGRRELSAGEIASHFPLTRPAISQHLRVLETSHVVSVRREGTRRLYRVNEDVVTKFLAELRAFWDSRLTRLKRAAEATERARRRR
jgi:DNA-binding transcriptional ArsR family regulator